MINYSVIIPHKNSPKLLAKSLASIPMRDDVQVIVVDDNSDVNLVDFSSFPKWNGVHYECYFTKEGKGAGYARNIGLSHAIGKWVLFMDADDYFMPSIDDIFDEYLDNEAEVIYFRPKAIMLDNTDIYSQRADSYNDLIDKFIDTNDEDCIRIQFSVPWSKFIKRSLIEKHNIRFEEIPYGNDVFFSTMTGCYASKISVSNEHYYTVTESTNSLTSSFLSKPGELLSRSYASVHAQEILYKTGRDLDFETLLMVLRPLYKFSRRDFFICFEKIVSFNVSRIYLIRLILANRGKKSKLKMLMLSYVYKFIIK